MHHFCCIPTQTAQPKFNHKKRSDQPKLEKILQNKWPALFKFVKVIKVQGRLRNFSRLKETKEIQQLNITYDSELRFFPCENILGTIDEM